MCRNYFGVVIGEPGNPKAVESPNRSKAVVPPANTKSTGRFFQVMAQTAVDKIPPGPKLDALTAEKVFGWKNVHAHDGELYGKRPDKLGRWRSAKILPIQLNPSMHIQ